MTRGVNALAFLRSYAPRTADFFVLSFPATRPRTLIEGREKEARLLLRRRRKRRRRRRRTPLRLTLKLLLFRVLAFNERMCSAALVVRARACDSASSPTYAVVDEDAHKSARTNFFAHRRECTGSQRGRPRVSLEIQSLAGWRSLPPETSVRSNTRALSPTDCLKRWFMAPNSAPTGRSRDADTPAL